MGDVGKGDGGGGGRYVPLDRSSFSPGLRTQFFAPVETWQSGVMLCMQLKAAVLDSSSAFFFVSRSMLQSNTRRSPWNLKESAGLRFEQDTSS